MNKKILDREINDFRGVWDELKERVVVKNLTARTGMSRQHFTDCARTGSGITHLQTEKLQQAIGALCDDLVRLRGSLGRVPKRMR